MIKKLIMISILFLFGCQTIPTGDNSRFEQEVQRSKNAQQEPNFVIPEVK